MKSKDQIISVTQIVYDASKALYQAKFMLQQISLLIAEAKKEVE